MIKLTIESHNAFDLMADLKEIAFELRTLLPPEPVNVPAGEYAKESPHD